MVKAYKHNTEKETLKESKTETEREILSLGAIHSLLTTSFLARQYKINCLSAVRPTYLDLYASVVGVWSTWAERLPQSLEGTRSPSWVGKGCWVPLGHPWTETSNHPNCTACRTSTVQHLSTSPPKPRETSPIVQTNCHCEHCTN